MTNNQLTEIPVTDDEIQRVLDAFDYRTGIESHEEHIVRCALAELHERRKAASEPVAYLVCNGRLYQDRAFMSPLMAEESVKNRNDGAEIKALCVCGKAECAE